MMIVFECWAGWGSMGSVHPPLAKAGKVLDVLVEHNVMMERQMLQDRIAQMTTVQQLLSKRIETLLEGDLVKYLGVLGEVDVITALPFHLKCGLTGRLLTIKFDKVVSLAMSKDRKAG